MRRWMPGVLVALAAAGLAWAIHFFVPWIPWLTAALVIGVVAGCIPSLRPALDGVLKPGLGIAARRLLRVGIVVLGLQLSLRDIAALGWPMIVGIVLLVAIAFGATYGVARLFRLPGDEPVLLAAGFSICGVSAVGAVSAARRSPADDSAVPTALVTLYGTAAILVLPALARLLNLPDTLFGEWVGLSVHDVGQVVATAQIGGAAALSVAVVVKLTRVLLLAPITAIAAVHARRRGADAGPRPPIVPLFILGFVALVLVRTFLPVPDLVVQIAAQLQSALLAAALFGIGAGLRLEKLVRSGARAIGAGAVSWIVILAVALGIALGASTIPF